MQEFSPQRQRLTSLGDVEAVESRSARRLAFPFGASEHKLQQQQSTPIRLARIKGHAENPVMHMALSLDVGRIVMRPVKYSWPLLGLCLQFRFCLLKMWDILLELFIGFPAHPPLQE